MARVSIRPSESLGRLLRAKRNDLGLSLEQISDRTRRRGRVIPASTLARIEQGETDPGVLRLVDLLQLYEIPAQLALDLVDLQDLSGIPIPSGDLRATYEEGLAAWRRGDVKRGLACFYAIRQEPVLDPALRLLRQKANLTFSIAAKNLGRFRLALQLLDELLCEPPDESLLLPAFIHAAAVWAGLGSPAVGLAFIDRAERLVDPSDAQRRAWVLHQRAHLLAVMGQAQESEVVLCEAEALYRSIDDTFGLSKAMLLRVRRAVPPRPVEQQLEDALELVRYAEQHGHALIAAHAELQVGRLLIAVGRSGDALPRLERALGHALLNKEEGNLEFLAHFYAWKASVETGNDARARLELEEARYHARAIEEAGPEKSEIDTLELRKETRHAPRKRRRPLRT